MKLKKQNVWLALVGFVQVIFIAAIGTFVTEVFKSNGNLRLVDYSLAGGACAAIVIAGIYLKVFRNSRKR